VIKGKNNTILGTIDQKKSLGQKG